MIKVCQLLLFIVVVLFAQPLNTITTTLTIHNIGSDVLFDGATPENTVTWHTRHVHSGKYIARLKGKGMESNREILLIK